MCLTFDVTTSEKFQEWDMEGFLKDEGTWKWQVMVRVMMCARIPSNIVGIIDNIAKMILFSLTSIIVGKLILAGYDVAFQNAISCGRGVLGNAAAIPVSILGIIAPVRAYNSKRTIQNWVNPTTTDYFGGKNNSTSIKKSR